MYMQFTSFEFMYEKISFKNTLLQKQGLNHMAFTV